MRSALTRRTFLEQTATGLGVMALSTMVPGANPQAVAGGGDGPWRGVIDPPHVPPRAKRVIYLYMAGGPSHLESFDYRPQLARMHGQPMPESFTRGQPIAQLQGAQLRCFAPQHAFRRFGRSGQEVAQIFPHIGSIADDICIVRSMRTEAINHDPAP